MWKRGVILHLEKFVNMLDYLSQFVVYHVMQMWSRIVWMEGAKELEDVVPLCWIIGNFLHWPPASCTKKVVESLMNSMACPEDDWRTFPIVKRKIESGMSWLFKINHNTDAVALLFYEYHCLNTN